MTGPTWIRIEEAPGESPTLIIDFDTDWQTFDLHCEGTQQLRLTISEEMAAQLASLYDPDREETL